MNDGEEISTNDEVVGSELRMSLKVLVATAEPAQTEELGVRVGELGVGWLGGKRISLGRSVSR